MKIVHATEIDIGGTATVLHLLLTNQIADTSISSLACVIPKTLESTLTTIPKETFRTYERTGRNIKSLYNFCSAFAKTVWQQKPDIVHIHSTFAGILGRLILLFMLPFRRPKIVYCPHGFSFLMEGSNIKRKIFSYLEVLLSLATHKIICVSNYEKNSAINSGINPNKIVVIHNGTPIIEASTSTQNSPYTGAKEIKNYLFAGRLDAAKGFDLLLSAMRRIDDKSIHLTVAGISSNEVHDSAKLDNINYLGWMKSEQLRPYFIHADALILPSRWEGFPMVVLEAMSLGIPVLASNCTSLSEAVDHGQTGLLFDTSDIDNISNALTAIDQNTLKQMGVKGRERFQKYFTSDIMTKSTISLYSKLKHNNGMRNLKGAV